MATQNTTRVTFLGASTALPTAAEDNASFVINDTHMVDTPSSAARALLQAGLDPVQLRTVIFTHFHHDHYMGLPQLLFYRAMKGCCQGDPGPLMLCGPGDLDRVVRLSHAFLQAEAYPVVWPTITSRILAPGDTACGPGFRLQAIAARHAVEGLCYRFTDTATGAVIVFTGDTEYHEPIAELARGADLLIHEASFAADASRSAIEQTRHSTTIDAARVAKLADVRKLALIHYDTAHSEERLAEALSIFPNAVLAKAGETLEVSHAP
jgi:ribonuclease Z